MNGSQSSGSGSNTNSRGMILMGEVRCHCGLPSVVKKAWTDENPGRRFYGCGDVNWKSCNFFRWFDVEKPHGWQKAALLEARELIRDQVEELKTLKALVGNGSQMKEGKEIESRIKKSEMWLEMEKKNKKLELEIASTIEREKLGRQFVIISWVGFVCLTAVIVKALK